jgi:hypothetical protein
MEKTGTGQRLSAKRELFIGSHQMGSSPTTYLTKIWFIGRRQYPARFYL